MKPNVIIVDDIDVNRFLIKEIIKEKPIEITEATNGEECINLINNNVSRLCAVPTNLHKT